jgi:hypothetical protein
VIRGTEDQAVGFILLEKLQERVENTPDLADVVDRGPLPTECVELVEQVDGASLGDCVEHEPELRGGLAHVLGDEAVELDREQRQPELAGEDARGHRLTGPRVPKQQELADRREPVIAEPIAVALLAEDPIDALEDLVGQRHVAEPRLRVVDDQKAGELAARLHERNDRLGACGERLSATTANLLDYVA